MSNLIRWMCIVVVGCFAALVVARTVWPNSPARLPPADTTVTLTIEGMACVACAGRLEKLVRDIDGVRSATVKFETGEARVEFDSTKTAPAAFAARIADAGFKAVPPR